MFRMNYEEYIKSQGFTYEDVLEGYKITLKIIKRVNENDYQNIIRAINKVYKNNPEKFKQFVQDIKLKANGQLANLSKYNFLDNVDINVWSCIFGLKLADLSATSPYSIDVSSLNGTVVFPYSDINYTVYPLLDYNSIKDDGVMSGILLVDKTKTTVVLGKERTIVSSYVVYKQNNKYYITNKQKSIKINPSKITKEHIELNKDIKDIVR